MNAKAVHLQKYLDYYRSIYPNAVIIVARSWTSLFSMNSKARVRQPCLVGLVDCEYELNFLGPTHSCNSSSRRGVSSRRRACFRTLHPVSSCTHFPSVSRIDPISKTRLTSRSCSQLRIPVLIRKCRPNCGNRLLCPRFTTKDGPHRRIPAPHHPHILLLRRQCSRCRVR